MRSWCLVFLLVAGVNAASAQEWTQWRGPSRDGIVPAAVIPTQWPRSTKRAWQVEIGEGYSSPVVANGRAFLHSRRDPQEIVTAIPFQDDWHENIVSPLWTGTALIVSGPRQGTHAYAIARAGNA